LSVLDAGWLMRASLPQFLCRSCRLNFMGSRGGLIDQPVGFFVDRALKFCNVSIAGNLCVSPSGCDLFCVVDFSVTQVAPAGTTAINSAAITGSKLNPPRPTFCSPAPISQPVCRNNSPIMILLLKFD
jgi:hypothetical protein